MVGMMRKRRGWVTRVLGWDALVTLIDRPPDLQVQRCRQPSIAELRSTRLERVRGSEILVITEECDWR